MAGIYCQLATLYPQGYRGYDYMPLINEGIERYCFTIENQYLSSPQLQLSSDSSTILADGRYHKTILDLCPSENRMLYTSTNAINEEDSKEITFGQLAYWVGAKLEREIRLPYIRGFCMECSFESILEKIANKEEEVYELKTRKGIRFGEDAYYTTGTFSGNKLFTIYGSSEKQSRDRCAVALIAKAQEAGRVFHIIPDLSLLQYDDPVVQKTLKWFSELAPVRPQLSGIFRQIKIENVDIPIIITGSSGIYTLTGGAGGRMEIYGNNKLRHSEMLLGDRTFDSYFFSRLVQVNERVLYCIRITFNSIVYKLFYVTSCLKKAGGYDEGSREYSFSTNPMTPTSKVRDALSLVGKDAPRVNKLLSLSDVAVKREDAFKVASVGKDIESVKFVVNRYLTTPSKPIYTDSALAKMSQTFGIDVESVVKLLKIVPLSDCEFLIEKYDYIPFVTNKYDVSRIPAIVVCMDDNLLYANTQNGARLSIHQLRFDGGVYYGYGNPKTLRQLMEALPVKYVNLSQRKDHLSDALYDVLDSPKTLIMLMDDIRKRIEEVTRANVVEALRWMIRKKIVEATTCEGTEWYSLGDATDEEDDKSNIDKLVKVESNIDD